MVLFNIWSSHVHAKGITGRFDAEKQA